MGDNATSSPVYAALVSNASLCFALRNSTAAGLGVDVSSIAITYIAGGGNSTNFTASDPGNAAVVPGGSSGGRRLSRRLGLGAPRGLAAATSVGTLIGFKYMAFAPPGSDAVAKQNEATTLVTTKLPATVTSASMLATVTLIATVAQVNASVLQIAFFVNTPIVPITPTATLTPTPSPPPTLNPVPIIDVCSSPSTVIGGSCVSVGVLAGSIVGGVFGLLLLGLGAYYWFGSSSERPASGSSKMPSSYSRADSPDSFSASNPLHGGDRGVGAKSRRGSGGSGGGSDRRLSGGGSDRRLSHHTSMSSIRDIPARYPLGRTPMTSPASKQAHSHVADVLSGGGQRRKAALAALELEAARAGGARPVDDGDGAEQQREDGDAEAFSAAPGGRRSPTGRR